MAAPESPRVTRGPGLPVRSFSYPEVQFLRLQTLCSGRRKCPRMTSGLFAAGAGSAHSHLHQFRRYCLQFGGARENAWYADVGGHEPWGDFTEFQKAKAEGGAITCEGHWVADMGLESEFSCSQGSAVLCHHPEPLACKPGSASLQLAFPFAEPKRAIFLVTFSIPISPCSSRFLFGECIGIPS